MLLLSRNASVVFIVMECDESGHIASRDLLQFFVVKSCPVCSWNMILLKCCICQHKCSIKLCYNYRTVWQIHFSSNCQVECQHHKKILYLCVTNVPWWLHRFPNIHFISEKKHFFEISTFQMLHAFEMCFAVPETDNFFCILPVIN